MSEFRRFTFNTDFGHIASEAKGEEAGESEKVEGTPKAEEPPPPPPPPTFSEEEMAQAHDQARAEGMELGRAEAEASTERMLANALNVVAAGMEGLTERQARHQEDTLRFAVQVAMAITAKVLPEMVARHGPAEIEALVRRILPELFEQERVVIRVAPDLADPLRDKLEAVARDVGFEGRLLVAPEEGLSPGDCRLEWNEGGAERIARRTWDEVEDIVASHLAVHRDEDDDTNEIQPTARSGPELNED